MLKSKLLIKFTNQQNIFNFVFVFAFAIYLTFNCKCEIFSRFYNFFTNFSPDERSKTKCVFAIVRASFA